ncbi:MAG: winged helix-turn-helix transcriptional regulator [Methanomassiliicoccales archaeon]|nr:MAG: winged helix-turn-helix transcriptional regulator [Methanomassiliicoccales archaeon]
METSWSEGSRMVGSFVRHGRNMRKPSIARFFTLALLASFLLALSPQSSAFPVIVEVNEEVASPGVGPVYVSDMDGDGRNDILVVDGDGNVTVYLQNPSGGDFPFNETVLVDSSPTEGMVAGLLDSDGSMDIASFDGDSLTLNFQDGPGVFSKHVIDIGFDPNAMAIGDLNGDARSDLVLVGDAEVLVLFGNDSTPDVYNITDSFGNQTGGNDVAVGDLGGSRGCDLVVASPSELYLFIQGREGLVLNQTIPLSGVFTHSSVAVGDFNGDLQDDVVVLRTNNGTDEVMDIIGRGEDGNFTVFQSMENDEFGNDFAVGDLNDDGLSDIAVVADSGESSILLYLQQSRARSEFTYFLLGNFSDPGGRIALGELNGDPYTDIVLRVQNTTYIFYQDDFPPFNANHVPSGIYFNENTIGDNLISLDDYLTDDHTQLTYYLDYESDPDLLHAVVDGSYLDFYPKEDWVGTAKFRVAGWDGNHTVYSNKFIVGVNDVPEIVSEPVTYGRVREEYLYQVVIEDTFPRDDHPMFELAWSPEGMVINPHNGEITWTPKQNGEFKVVVIVEDKYGGVAQQVFFVQIGEEEVFPTLALFSGLALIGILAFCAAVIAGNENVKFAFFLLFIPLYSKIRRDKILDHFVRGKIYGYILANPGEHYNAIREALSLTNGSVAFHLRTLEREEFIKSRKFGIYRRFYPMNMRIPDDGFRVNEMQKIILGTIKHNPGISQKEIAVFVNLTPPTINYHVGILLNAGLIHLRRKGRRTQCYLE